MEINCASVCNIGQRRRENQDAVFTEIGEGWGLFLVADGMGGHSDGAWASEAILEAYAGWLGEVQELLPQADTPFLLSELRRVLEGANDRIYRHGGPEEVCGSTAVVLLIAGNRYFLLSVGDSRCYELKRRFRKVELCQMTTDEIVGLPGRDYGKLTNAVGTRVPLCCKAVSGTLDRHPAFFLCSDGVYKMCGEEELLSALRGARPDRLAETVGKVGQMVEAAGARDNYSAVLVTVRR